ncbi:Glucan endo-1,3-alpha-glucosidase [Lachnellula subtilissima]|uniref:Glucan endo-1,3-alpha-glucosidase n=1 Tax=Lachnellula subtilissima TaxID=602034 RepID=A0A8H8RCT0_9HELO|nr:Glucan endo-1,3-alpha-glucosidase [Lachnellula subtilissima]
MKFFTPLLAAATYLLQTASAGSVFAHVVVGNTGAHNVAAWSADIKLAQAAGIDAFVLNMGYPDSNIPTQVANAFAAAAGTGFKLFFAFDYLGGGQVWPAGSVAADPPNSVVSYLLKYKDNAAYFHYNSAPFVSTFEGKDNTADWAPGGPIRSKVGAIHFVPNWNSIGQANIGAQLDNIEGFFSWDMWPLGGTNKTDAIDKSWKAATPGKTYMMGVSPWFFHSASGGEDWVWRGDSLWADRWAQTLDIKPDFVQIVTWNDFGEAHYIGPISNTADVAAGSLQYVQNMPHDSWREFLPYYIAAYKGKPLIPTRDQMQYWYRTAPVNAGNTCGVVGNSAGNGQATTTPNQILEDGVFFSALLVSAAQVQVQIGSAQAVTFQGSAGINHWSVPFNGQTGTPKFSVLRGGAVVNSGTGAAITAGTSLANGCANYNAWVGSF